MTHWPDAQLTSWIGNAGAEIERLGVARIAVTRTQTPRIKFATYIHSLRSAWFDYAAHELADRQFLAMSMRTMGWLAKQLGLDQVVLVGNDPISTNIWDASTQLHIAQLCRLLLGQCPQQYIGVRNLVPKYHAELMDALSAMGFYRLPARVIYEFDCRSALKNRASHLQRDRALLRKCALEVSIQTTLNVYQARQLCALYRSIYVEKHSALNPQYTEQFFMDMVNSGLMRCLLLQDVNGVVMAFALMYQVESTLTVPALGYEVLVKGLYRMLFAAIMNHVESDQLLLNYSSGAGDFKRKRGAQAVLEYTMLRAPSQNNRISRLILSSVAQYAHRVSSANLIALGA